MAMRQAAQKQGKAEAGVTLPDMPAECAKEEAHAALYEGAEALVVLKQERRATARANARIRRCNGTGGFYDQLRAGLEAKP